MARVLAVDDSQTMRDMIRFALAPQGFHVEVAEDGLDGLEKVRAFRPDAVITDINMPRLDGFGLIEAIRASEDAAHLPVLVLTTESADDLKARAREAGATGWIVKPFATDKLVRALRLVTG